MSVAPSGAGAVVPGSSSHTAPAIAIAMPSQATARGRSPHSSPHPIIVACQPTDGTIVPEEAAQILRAGTNEIIGRITSSRMSPTLGRSICLAQVTKEFAAAGTSLEVLLVDGRRVTATVMEHHAHFDPEGERLRG